MNAERPLEARNARRATSEDPSSRPPEARQPEQTRLRRLRRFLRPQQHLCVCHAARLLTRHTRLAVARFERVSQCDLEYEAAAHTQSEPQWRTAAGVAACGSRRHRLSCRRGTRSAARCPKQNDRHRDCRRRCSRCSSRARRQCPRRPRARLLNEMTLGARIYAASSGCLNDGTTRCGSGSPPPSPLPLDRANSSSQQFRELILREVAWGNYSRRVDGCAGARRYGFVMRDAGCPRLSFHGLAAASCARH